MARVVILFHNEMAVGVIFQTKGLIFYIEWDKRKNEKSYLSS